MALITPPNIKSITIKFRPNIHLGFLENFQTYVAPNKLPSWKRIHKVNFLGTLVFTNELPNWKRILYIKGNFLSTLVFTNELPNWKRIHKGKKTGDKKRKKNGKNRGKNCILYYGGGYYFFRELAYFIPGGLLYSSMRTLGSRSVCFFFFFNFTNLYKSLSIELIPQKSETTGFFDKSWGFLKHLRKFGISKRVWSYTLVNIQETMENHHF